MVSALYFVGHIDNSRGFMKMTKLVPQMIDKSRFNRRLHQVRGLLFSMFYQIGHCLKSIAGASEDITQNTVTTTRPSNVVRHLEGLTEINY